MVPAALAVAVVGLITRAGTDAPLSAGINATKSALQNNEFISYAPGNGWSPGNMVTKQQLASELLLLHNTTGRDGVITYGMTDGLDKVPEVAKASGFKYVIVGLWNPATEMSLITASNQNFIDGILIGNEGICRGLNVCGSGTPNWTISQLTSWVATARQNWPDKLVVTSEVWLLYDSQNPNFQPALLTTQSGDVVFPNVHPVWDSTPQVAYCPQVGVQFVQNVVNQNIAGGNPQMPVVLHESWWPSAPTGNTCNGVTGCIGSPNGYNEAAQSRYFSLLASSGIKFVWGEAFDQPWKGEATNGCGALLGRNWGLWKNDYTPKQVVNDVVDETGFHDGFESGNATQWQWWEPHT